VQRTGGRPRESAMCRNFVAFGGLHGWGKEECDIATVPSRGAQQTAIGAGVGGSLRYRLIRLAAPLKSSFSVPKAKAARTG
jgi:hypothetical protein